MLPSFSLWSIAWSFRRKIRTDKEEEVESDTDNEIDEDN